MFYLQDLLESGAKIVKGVLGMISNQAEWEKRVEEGKTLEEMVGTKRFLFCRYM